MPQPQNFKCANCGAAIAPEDKICKYCSDPNPNWHNPEDKNETQSTYTTTTTTTTTTTVSKGPLPPQTHSDPEMEEVEDGDNNDVDIDLGNVSVPIAAAPSKPPFPVKGCLVVVLFLIGFVIFFKLVIAPKNAKEAADLAVKQQSWIYTSHTDEQEGSVFYTAEVRSKNTIRLSNYPSLGSAYPPVNVYAFLHLSFNGGQNAFRLITIQFKNEKGTQQLATPDSEFVEIKFDDLQPRKVDIHDDGATIMVSDDEQEITTALKKANTTVITVYLKNNPTHKLEFNTSNLQWNH